jgi:23S rRNA pseudouridine1911/1915/1917 synthase
MEKKAKLKTKTSYKRLDLFLSKKITEISRSEIGKLIKEGKVRVNNEIITKKNTQLEKDETVEIIFDIREDFYKNYSPTLEFNKLYEDEYILIINKPAGLTVHPGSGPRRETVMDILLYNYPNVKKISDTDRPGIVHRLDKDTSGVLILAKDKKTMDLIQAMFKEREISKTYTALIYGKPRFINGIIDLPINRNKKNKTKFTVSEDEDARPALTEYKLIENYGKVSLLELYPKTGRTHQLRVHMAHQKTPILGDKVYGRKDNEEFMYLHATKINFIHPITEEEITITAPLPDYFKEKIKSLYL